ncbi:MAG: hypothetical protein ABJD24_09940 [Acidimicrobiales bacterium]
MPRALSQIRTASQVPVYVGARNERFNRWASEAADGVLVAGVPLPFIGNVVDCALSVKRQPAGNLSSRSAFRPPRADARGPEVLGADSAALSAAEDPQRHRDRRVRPLGTTGSIVDRLRWLVARFQPTTIGLPCLSRA